MGDDKLQTAVYWEDSERSDKDWYENLLFDTSNVEQAKQYALKNKLEG